ncbi:decapping and exoribonuclease protein-like isoform X1 [Amphibalanus amphitrite]|uniref:decapping and exoribonuclease protein-like isoform X1 n=1 Tax=Amphibalanus amphitrite TaxID=1232801 RepID=UPI001C927278|nr:decapping and exoribonuclease protein-like isoform X1 [Amphibalanus amphitrite]XP_043216382.1 decapping and exoribonuclease protein-like isoform X1 [Amphibalanus amphitrite]XP_043216394.1 decapping and exoribonuclease protein-like isoform X1 [Amphibalanus amphitrite]XP_043216421.1 decapping and exoribonuclease protein-like isoform X1 [Amphibalanus amphitrite]XP_043216429.1 decapping and exoribonuclease protein-like isoform X1 [Amphibalanus amphitrite]XP_043216439.1 decapping and exoribonucl
MESCLPTSGEKYDGHFPFFRQPTKVGEFSLDEKRDFHHSSCQKKYISWPLKRPLDDGQSVDVHFDLNLLLDRAVRKDDSQLDERLDNLLKWILKNQEKFKLQDRKASFSSLSTDFVCYRGLITKLMATPYENREPWIICATKWRGTIYLCAFDTEQKIADRQRETPRQKAMSSWGYKFEQYMMSDSPGAAPDPHTPAVESAEFCCVLRSRLGRHSVVYGAEVDGVDPHREAGDGLSMAQFVELKTSREVETPRQRNSLQRFKMLKWWAQSFLVGIERVVVGFRDDDGTVHRLHAYATKQLPKEQDFWSPSVCMNFAAAFLAWAAEQVTGDDPRAVWRFEFEPRRRRVTCQSLGRSERYRILPDWYTENVFRPGPDT